MHSFTVYISSTYEDLKDHREAVYRAVRKIPDSLAARFKLDLKVVCMEDYVAKDERPVLRCCEDAREADVYVVILAARYGYIDPDAGVNPEGLSITEQEYRAARGSQKTKVVALLAHDDCPIPTKHQEADPASLTKLQTLKKETGTVQGVQFFKGKEDIGGLAAQAVQKAILELLGDDAPAPERRIRIGGTLPFHFIGKRFKDRQKTLALLMQKLDDPAVRVVVIEGRAGQGKSAVAARLCERLHAPPQKGGSRLVEPTPTAIEMGITGVAYHSFREQTGAILQKDEVRRRLSFSRDQFVEAFVHALPEVERPTFSSWRQANQTASDSDLYKRMLHHATDGHILVVFDNFEDALDDREHIASSSLGDFFRALLAGTCAVTVLITTRRSVSFALPSVAAIAQFPELERLPEDDCVDLLRELDGPDGLNGRARLATADERTLRKLSRLADGNPRAIELIAHKLQRDRKLTPEAFSGNPKTQDEFLDQLLEDAWAHAFAWERETACALAILGRPATAEEVAAVLGERPGIDASKCLESLCDTYLAFYQPESETYLLHEKDRAYLLSKMDSEDARLKHRAAAALARAHKCEPEELDSEEKLKPWQEEFEHLMAANDPRAAWEAVNSIVPFVLWEKNLARIALDWVPGLLAVADDGLREALLVSWTVLLRWYGRYTELLSVASELRMRAERSGNDEARIISLKMEIGALNSLGKNAEAEPLCRRLLAVVEEGYGAGSLAAGAILGILASLLRDTGRLVEAEHLDRRALTICRKQSGSDENMSNALDNLAGSLWFQCRFAEAEALNRRALDLAQRALGALHPSVAKSCHELARSLEATGKFSEAKLLHRRALDISEAFHGPDHPDSAAICGNLSRVLAKMERGADAVEAAKRALQIDGASPNAAEWFVGVDLHNLSGALIARESEGDVAEAASSVEKALEILRRTLSPDHHRVGSALRTAAKVACARSDFAAALESLREAAVIILSRESVPLLWAAEVHEELCEVLKRLGNTEAAADAAAKGADYRAKFDAQEAHAREMIARDPEWIMREMP